MKRMIDVVVSLILLVMLSPIWLVVSILIRIKMGAPIFFKQERPGLSGTAFHVYKFRTMNHREDRSGDLLADRNRITPLGSILRKLSLDELPQLLNVVKGEMSLVGPRPLLMEYLPLYTVDQKLRHKVKPGITGWAQINGRNAITWEEKFELDSWYVNNRTIWLDIKIMLLTIIKVLKRDGITHEDHLSMEKFTGSNEGI